MTTLDGAAPISKEVETPQMEKASNRLLGLIDRLETALEGSDTSKSAQPCCLKILKAEEDAHKKTLAQLQQMATERDALRVQYSNKQTEYFTITAKLTEMRNEETRKLTDEQSEHKKTRASLVAMTDARNGETRKLMDEQSGHENTRAKLEVMTRKLMDEQSRYENTRAKLEVMVRNLTDEQSRYENTRAELEVMERNLTDEQSRYENTRAKLEVMARNLTDKQSRHENTRAKLEVMARKLTDEPSEHKKTKDQLDAIKRLPPALKVPHKPEDLHSTLSTVHEHVLSGLRAFGSELVNVDVDIPWELAGFLSDGFAPGQALGAVLILNGTAKQAHALTIAEYLGKMWGSMGGELLDVLESALSEVSSKASSQCFKSKSDPFTSLFEPSLSTSHEDLQHLQGPT